MEKDMEIELVTMRYDLRDKKDIHTLMELS